MNEIEIVVASKDKSDLDKIADKAKKAGKEIGEGVEKGVDQAEKASERGGKKIRESLDKVGKAGRDAGEGIASGFGEALDGIASSVGGPLGDLGGVIQGGISGAKAGALAGGAAIGAFIVSGIEAEMAEDKVGGLLAAQTGAASSSAERLGDVAGDVFADNFGESIEEVGVAMESVFENKLIKTDAPEAAIQRVTEKVMTLATTTGLAAEEISEASSQMIKTGIADSFDQAADMIGRAQELGLNASGQLAETMTEYSTHFRQLGLDGAESFGLMSQATEAGARDIDYAADALKEFSIRGQDMSDTTRRGFEAIGLDADAMGQMIAKGGKSAHEALRLTLNALQDMPPSVERNSAAVDLFGTKAEDLGNALFEMDLDGARRQFGDFGGTVEDMMKKIDESTSFWDKLGKSVSSAASSLGEFLDMDTSEFLEAAPELKGVFEDINKAQNDFDATGNMAALDALKDRYPDLADEIDAYVKKKREEQDATESATAAVEGQITTIDDLIAKYSEAAGGMLGLSEAQIGNREAIDAANESLEKNKANLDINTKAGQENQSALNDIISSTYDVVEAMRQQNVSSEEVTGFVQAQRDEYIRLATAMGMDAHQAQIMADKLGLIPGNYKVNIVMNDVEYQRYRAQQFKNLIDSIPNSKTVNLRVSTSGSGHYLAGLAHGGIVSQQPWGAASGGQRHSSTVIDEAGPELVELPSGARVATAGATRAMAEAGWLGGNGGPVVANFIIGGPTDELGQAIANWLRKYVKNEYGGSATEAFGQRGST